MIKLKGKYAEAVIYTQAEPLENALAQIQGLIDHPVAEGTNVRIMPDYHAGKGCVIGTTMKLEGRVSPSLVGVDIGCGVLCYKFKSAEELNLSFLDNYIRKNIPHGRGSHEEVSDIRQREWFNSDKFKTTGLDNSKINRAIGTLGGGNHFIEIGKDDDGFYYLFVHSGSRYLGAMVAKYYQKLAVEQERKRLVLENSKSIEAVADIMGSRYIALRIASTFFKPLTDIEREEQKEGKVLLKAFIATLKQTGRQSEINTIINTVKKEMQNVEIADESLCYLTGEAYENYLHDMELAQKYAKVNRMLIANTIMLEINGQTVERFDSIHNYIDIENGILRKGAISAQKGERLLIPLNMRDGVIVGTGKGNEDWNYSAPHGAGRLQSRTASRKEFNLEDFKTQMEGVYSTCVEVETIDESPSAYKPIEHILDVINETVEVEKIVKPIYNFKGVE